MVQDYTLRSLIVVRWRFSISFALDRCLWSAVSLAVMEFENTTSRTEWRGYVLD